MPFEFDPDKSTANKGKHGIDFAEAQALWSDPIGSRCRRDRMSNRARSWWGAFAKPRGPHVLRIVMKKQSASSRSGGREHARDRNTNAADRRTSAIPAEKFDELFDAGFDEIDEHVAWDKSRNPAREVQRVNVDFPVDLLRAIDREAKRIGVTRQAFIKLRLADTLTGR